MKADHLKNQAVLLTGLTGFIGTHLTRALIQTGAKVHGLIKDQPSAEWLAEFGSQVELHSYEGKVEPLIEQVGRIRPMVCFHLATFFRAAHQPSEITPMTEANITLGTHLAEAVSRVSGCLLVNIGTAWQHAGGETYRPVSLYAAMKQAMEDILAFYSRSQGLKTIHLKLFDTYGPADTRVKLLNVLIKQAGKSEPLKMSGGDQLIDLNYVGDVVGAMIAASRPEVVAGIDPSRGAATYAVCTGRALKVKEVAAIVEKVMGKKLELVWGAHPYRPIEMFEPWKVAGPVPGWRPEVTLEEGIKRVLAGGTRA